jgi:hypothetical protein
MATKVAAIHEVQPSDYENRGYLRGFMFIEVTDLLGNKQFSRVTIGRAFGIPLEDAKKLIQTARENNPDKSIGGRFILDL